MHLWCKLLQICLVFFVAPQTSCSDNPQAVIPWIKHAGESAESQCPAVKLNHKSSYSSLHAPQEPCVPHQEFMPYLTWQGVDPQISEWKSRWKEYMLSVPVIDAVEAAKSTGCGIVSAAGAYSIQWLIVVAKMLRAMGNKLPIEAWHFAGESMSEDHMPALQRLGITPRNVDDYAEQLGGYEWKGEGEEQDKRPFYIKLIALIYSSFDDIIFLDYDSYPTRDLTYLFQLPQYLETGAMFWPDVWFVHPDNPLYEVFEVPCRLEFDFESSVMLINKRLHWKALHLAWFMNQHRHYFYHFVHGDKDTLRFAFYALKEPFYACEYPAAVVGYRSDHDGSFQGTTTGHFDPDYNLITLHTSLFKATPHLGECRENDVEKMMEPFTTIQAIRKLEDRLSDVKIQDGCYRRYVYKDEEAAGRGKLNETGLHDFLPYAFWGHFYEASARLLHKFIVHHNRSHQQDQTND